MASNLFLRPLGEQEEELGLVSSKPLRPIMTPGTGKNSYARNSNGQAAFVDRVFENALKLVDEVKVLQDGTDVIKVADYGCSCGPNSIRNTETVLRRMKKRYREGETPEFQAFFQDLHDTDFNTLFQFFKMVSGNSAENASDKLKYFAAGVPGCCYSERMLPHSSVHFAMSTFALNWLSQIPPVVCDHEDTAFFGAHMKLQSASRATIDAYAEQANIDLRNFLNARAAEMAPGGIMFLVIVLRKDYYPYYINPTDSVAEKVWDEMISEGLVDAKLRDNFKNFQYCRHVGEVTEVLDSYTSLFQIEHKEVLPFFSYPEGLTAREQGARLVSLHRGIDTPLLEGHFGKKATDIFWDRFEQAVLQGFSDGTIVDHEESTYPVLVLVASKR